MAFLRLFMVIAAVVFTAVIGLLLSVFSQEAMVAVDQSGVALAVVILLFVAVALGLFLLYATVRIALADDRWWQKIDQEIESAEKQLKQKP